MFKLFNRKDKNLKYDFLPSAIEIIEKPASPLGKIIIHITAIFIFIILIWSFIAKIDNIVVSEGQAKPKDGVKVVDSNLNGKIKKINKVEGDHVKAGDVILEIENDNNTGQEEKTKSIIEEKKMMLDIIKHKIKNDSYDKVYDKYEISKNKIEEIKLDEDIKQEKEKKASNKYIESINNIDVDIKKTKKEIQELQEQYNNMKGPDKELNGKSIQSEIEIKNNQIKRLEKSKLEQEEEREEKKKTKKLEYVQERNKLEEELKQLNNNLNNIIRNNSNFVVKSPINGVILSSNYNTIGSYVSQSRPVAEIVPDNSELEIETSILNKDISRIEKGQDVIVKFESYDYQKYGTLEGKVEYISPNSFNNKNNELVYKVKVKFNKNQKKDIKILPGMVATLEIKCSKMRVIDYFLEPFKKSIDSSLKG